VDALHSEDNTADIFLDSGTYLNRVPVASREWAVSGEDAEKDYNSGERNLPPVQARVFIMMPTCTYNDCFVMPFSGFSTIDQPKPYMEDGREKIKERITPGGWHTADDYVTGSRKAVSPDKKTSLEIDYGTEGAPKEDAPELHLDLFDAIKVDIFADDRIEITVTNSTVEAQDYDIKCGKPIGLNDGLYKSGLAPYLTSETDAAGELETAAADAAPQLAVLDYLSGGAGKIIGLGAAVTAFCGAMKKADTAAHTDVSKAVK
jgi:hypothetical protein